MFTQCLLVVTTLTTGTSPVSPVQSALDAEATTPIAINKKSVWYQQARNQQNMALAEQGQHANILFLGDSVTDWLANGDGAPLWASFWAPLGAEDFAIGGIATSEVLWQVKTKQVQAVTPNVIVLCIGANNLIGGQDPSAVAAGIALILKKLERQLPTTRILLLGILPGGESPDNPLRPLIAQTNSMISQLAGPQVQYLDVGSQFLEPDGSISSSVMFDYFHPTLLGYQIYTNAIESAVGDMLLAGPYYPPGFPAPVPPLPPPVVIPPPVSAPPSPPVVIPPPPPVSPSPPVPPPAPVPPRPR
jgi:lysophospholipase L1-like esterase